MRDDVLAIMVQGSRTYSASFGGVMCAVSGSMHSLEGRTCAKPVMRDNILGGGKDRWALCH
jgi:hypothetical protein